MSEPGWVSEFLHGLQEPRLAFGLLVGCGACLLVSTAPGPIGSALQPARPWLAFGSIASGGVLLWDIGAAIKRKVSALTSRKQALGALTHLTGPERKQLALWLELDIRSGNLSIDGTVASLADRGLMVEVPNSRNLRSGMATYVIPEHIWKHLRRNPTLVQ